jgi:4-hydroxybenzoate polyprenyltransferase
MFAAITFLYRGKITYLYLGENEITISVIKIIVLFSVIYAGYISIYYAIMKRNRFLNQFISNTHFLITLLSSLFICYGIYEVSYDTDMPEMFRALSLNSLFPYFIGFIIIQVLALFWVILGSKPIENTKLIKQK